MASRRSSSVIVIVDDDDHIVGSYDDLEILNHAPNYPQVGRQIDVSVNGPYATGSSTQSRYLASSLRIPGLDSSSSSRRPTFDIVERFRSLDWDSQASPPIGQIQSRSTVSGRPSRTPSASSSSQQYRGSFSHPLSPMTEHGAPRSMLGTVEEPIDLGDDRYESGRGRAKKTSTAAERSMECGSYSLALKQGTSQAQQYIVLDDDEKEDPVHEQQRTTALGRSLTRRPTSYDDLIDLDRIEDDISHDAEHDAETLNPQNGKLQRSRRSSRALQIVRRNPPIVSPFEICKSFQHHGCLLVQNKSVELKEGGFLRIKDIIRNTKTGDVKIRGHRLQRARDMNGMLERKMNEVLLFFEVDLDDPRPPQEQSAVEIPLSEVERLRNVRLTNQKFPLARNIEEGAFSNQDELLRLGGLTARWKYTCIYACGAARHNNDFKERTLERIRAEECLKEYAVPDDHRRFQWRGQTILGGAYRPAFDVKLTTGAEPRIGSHINIESSPEPDDFAFVHVHSSDDFSSGDDEGYLGSSDEDENAFACLAEATVLEETGKRKYSELVVSSDEDTPCCLEHAKKMRPTEEKSVKETREGISRIDLQAEDSARTTRLPMIDLSCDSAEGNTSTSFCRTIDLTSSDLSNPPESGSIRNWSGSTKLPVVRTADQRLTYGDAFCGAGGSTRGAVMAGLRVVWGFDHWEPACKTWSTNFSFANCYHKAAHEFVELAKRSEARGNKDLMKVDILHLSPPCQFFSPAHTVDGVDDEMNTASLFAVQSIIEISRARVVTLEQTFGIAGPRFRFYFNALIQMFTTHDFSIRWAIVPLATWGLPQRRRRLIIIASCPGEILPKMPLPTHTNEFPAPPGLQPLVSVASVLSAIPPASPPGSRSYDRLHQPSQVTFLDGRRLAPWDPSSILPRAMTTSGGQNYHPSGTRDLTLREYAAFQGFPVGHCFRGKYVKKQIGNAVPPVVAKVLFESIRRDLDKADGIEEAPLLIE